MWLKIIALVVAVHSLTFAQAQEKTEVQRKGIIYGGSIGGSFTSIQYPIKKLNATDLAISLKIGYMLNPRLAVLLSSNVSIYDYSGFGRDRKRDFGVLAPSLQYWFNGRLWLLGGIGLGGDNPVFWDIKNPNSDTLETKYYAGLGVIGALGYELYQKNSFAVDIQLRTMYRRVTLGEGDSSGISNGMLIGIYFE